LVEQVEWGTSTDNPLDVSPGDTNVPLTVDIRNRSNLTLNGIYATLYLVYPFTNKSGGSIANAVGSALQMGDIMHPTGEVLPGGSFFLTFRLNIDLDAKPGNYPCTVTVEYLANESGYCLIGVPKNLTVTIVLPNKLPIIDSITPADTNPSVFVGDFLNFTCSCHDPDGDNLTYRWTIDDAIISNSSYFVYMPKDQDVGTHTVNLRVSDGISAASQTWTLQVEKIKTTSIMVSDNRLICGVDNLLNISIENNLWKGTVQVSLATTSPLVVYGNNSWIFRSVEPNDTLSISLNIYAPESSVGTTTTATLSVSYNDEYGQSQTDTYNVGLIIRGLIDLIVYDIELIPLPAYQGAVVTITATLLNRGNVDAKNVNVSIQPNPILELSALSRDYFDRIEKNSREPFNVRAQIKEDVPNGTYTVTVNIYYQDDQYRTHTINFTIPLQVIEREEGTKGTEEGNLFIDFLNKGGGALLILAGVAIVLLILYVRWAAKVQSNPSLRELAQESQIR